MDIFDKDHDIELVKFITSKFVIKTYSSGITYI